MPQLLKLLFDHRYIEHRVCHFLLIGDQHMRLAVHKHGNIRRALADKAQGCLHFRIHLPDGTVILVVIGEIPHQIIKGNAHPLGKDIGEIPLELLNGLLIVSCPANGGIILLLTGLHLQVQPGIVLHDPKLAIQIQRIHRPHKLSRITDFPHTVHPGAFDKVDMLRLQQLLEIDIGNGCGKFIPTAHIEIAAIGSHDQAVVNSILHK